MRFPSLTNLSCDLSNTRRLNRRTKSLSRADLHFEYRVVFGKKILTYFLEELEDTCEEVKQIALTTKRLNLCERRFSFENRKNSYLHICHVIHKLSCQFFAYRLEEKEAEKCGKMLRLIRARAKSLHVPRAEVARAGELFFCLSKSTFA